MGTTNAREQAQVQALRKGSVMYSSGNGGRAVVFGFGTAADPNTTLATLEDYRQLEVIVPQTQTVDDLEQDKK